MTIADISRPAAFPLNQIDTRPHRIIADRLHISIKTAEAHRANMMKKLRVSNTAQLLKTALEGGLLISTPT
jgi:FixJ family two-component response regulator